MGCEQELAQNTLPLSSEGWHLTSEPAAPAGSVTAVLNIALAAAASSQPLAEKSQIQPFLLCPCLLDAWRRWPDARGKSY